MPWISGNFNLLLLNICWTSFLCSVGDLGKKVTSFVNSRLYFYTSTSHHYIGDLLDYIFLLWNMGSIFCIYSHDQVRNNVDSYIWSEVQNCTVIFAVVCNHCLNHFSVLVYCTMTWIVFSLNQNSMWLLYSLGDWYAHMRMHSVGWIHARGLVIAPALNYWWSSSVLETVNLIISGSV